MKIERFESNGRMNQVVTAGDFIYLSGQTCGDSSDVQGQARLVLARIEELLKAHGSDKEHILTVQVFLKDIKTMFDAFNEVYDAWVVKGCEPTRACVEAELCEPELLVEIIVSAVKA